MPTVTTDDGATIFYRVDDFTDPWRRDVETVFLMHGFCRNSSFWFAYVPVLARHFRVVRWDARGCGESTKPPTGFPWTLERYHRDLVQLMDALGVERAHFVGESMGGMVMPYFANWYPERIESLSAISSNLAVKGEMGRQMSAGYPSMAAAVREMESIAAYSRATEKERLDPEETSEAMRAWFTEAWAAAPRQTWLEWSEVLVPQIDLTPEIFAGVRCPTLYIAATGSTRLSLDEAKVWTDNIPNARLETVETRSQAVAFVRRDECAPMVRDFLLEQSRGG